MGHVYYNIYLRRCKVCELKLKRGIKLSNDGRKCMSEVFFANLIIHGFKCVLCLVSTFRSIVKIRPDDKGHAHLP